MSDPVMDKSIREAAEKAHEIFKLFGWKFYDGKPGLSRLEEMIADLCKDAIKDEEIFMQISTGRITVAKSGDGETADYKIMLNLASFYDYGDESEAK